jgi:small subunit ribosomal protein S2
VAVVTMKQLLEAGVHFGHQTRRWNPKMRRFIFGERNGIYIIDLQQSLERIDTAYRFIRRTVEDGGTVLFVGTKKQSQEAVQKQAERSQSPYINYRWLGGMLTNFQTVHARVAKMQELERMVKTGETEQMIKKEGLKVKRELAKLERNLGGIRRLERLPSAIFVIDTKKEHIAVTEANRLGIPVVAIVDTNCDPDIIDYVIPGNDDAIRSANLMSRIVADAVLEGQFLYQRKHARKATTKEDVAAADEAKAVPPPPPLDPEEAKRRTAEQQKARNAAAAAQKERERKLAETKKPPPPPPPSLPPPAPESAREAAGDSATSDAATPDAPAAGADAAPAEPTEPAEPAASASVASAPEESSG